MDGQSINGVYMYLYIYVPLGPQSHWLGQYRFKSTPGIGFLYVSLGFLVRMNFFVL